MGSEIDCNKNIPIVIAECELYSNESLTYEEAVANLTYYESDLAYIPALGLRNVISGQIGKC